MEVIKEMTGKERKERCRQGKWDERRREEARRKEGRGGGRGV